MAPISLKKKKFTKQKRGLKLHNFRGRTFLYKGYIEGGNRWWRWPGLPVPANTHCISFQPSKAISKDIAYLEYKEHVNQKHTSQWFLTDLYASCYESQMRTR